MADLSGFSSSSFNTIEWINSAIRDRSDEDSLESYLAQLAMKLHIVSQDYTDQLETGMVEAMTTMPRIISEISRLEGSVKSIDEEMGSLAAQLKIFDEKNIAGVEDLSRLDTLKVNMERCRSMLEEHSQWSQLVREANSFLEGRGRLTDSADRIEVMVKSLDILKQMPGHVSRVEVCATLTESLLAIVRPKLSSDLNNEDIDPLHDYLHVYMKLGRQDELEEEYIRIRPQRIFEYWQGWNPTNGAGHFADWFSAFLELLDQLVLAESERMAILFGKEAMPRLLSTMIENIFTPIAVAVSERLAATHHPVVIVNAFEQVNEFAGRAVSYLEGIDSHRKFCLLSAVFGGFIVFMDSYPDLEGDYLKQQFVAILDSVQFEEEDPLFGYSEPSSSHTHNIKAFSLASCSNPVEACLCYGDRLVSACDLFFVPATSSVHRAISFMSALRVKLTLKAISASLANFVKALTTKIDDLKYATGHNDKSDDASPIATAPVSHSQSWSKKLESCDLGGRELVPVALRVLQAAGRLTRRLRELDLLSMDVLSSLGCMLFKEALSSSMLLFRSSSSNANFNAGSNPQLASLTNNTTSAASQSIDSQIPTTSNTCAQFASQLLQNNPSASSEFKSFLSSSTSSNASQLAFAGVTPLLSKMKTTAGALLFDLCCAAPSKLVSELHHEEVWKSPTKPECVDNDSMLPQAVFTQIGEHLLSLVQELEAIASSEALGDLNQLTGDAFHLIPSSSGWLKLKNLLELPREDDSVELLCKRVSSASTVVSLEKTLFGSTYSVGAGELVAALGDSGSSGAVSTKLAYRSTVAGAMEEDDAAALHFVNEWLGAIADAIIGQVIVHLARVPVLSAQGRQQLQADIEYLSNVLNAMGLKQHPLMEHIYHLSMQDADVSSTALDTVMGRSNVVLALHKLDSRIIAAMLSGK